MKKSFLFLAALLVASTFTLISCGSDDEGYAETADPGEAYNMLEKVTLPEASLTTSYKFTVENHPEVKSFEILNGCCFIELAGASASVRAVTNDKYIFGTWLITPEVIKIKTDKYSITINWERMDIAYINGDEVNIKQDKDVIASSLASDYLCRDWKPTSFHAYITSGGKIYYNKKKSDLIELQKDLLRYILGSEPKERDYIFSSNIDIISFSKAGTFVTLYTNKDSEVKKWDWKGSDGKLTVANSDESTFLTATAKFSGDTMFFIIDVPIPVKSEAIDVEDTKAKLVISFDKITYTNADPKNL